MTTRIPALAVLSAVLFSLTGCAADAETPAAAQVFAMDTVMDLTAYGASGEKAVSQAEEELYRLEAELSRTREDSEVTALNEAGTAHVGADVAALLKAALTYSQATGDAFDITVAPVVSAWGFTTDHYQVPSQETLDALLGVVDDAQIQVAEDADGAQVTLGAGQSVDLGGIAKGYAADRVAQIFVQEGVEHGMISLGGNVYVRGTKPDGSPWRVGVQNPAQTDENDMPVGILTLTDCFAVTSGGYQRYFEQDGVRYHHIIDPATGFPADSGLQSVTVVAPAGDETAGAGAGTMCDAFSTALFVMGEEKALDFWRTSGYDFDLVLVTDDGRVVVTDGLKDRFYTVSDAQDAEGSGYTYETVS